MMNGKIYTDDGREVKRSEIPVPELCRSCSKCDECDPSCDLTRMDQKEDIREGGVFCCFAYEPKESDVDRDAIFSKMESYLAGKR